MTQKIALDLFCKAGGASVGYAQAGFKVVGVDIEPQKNYPFEFHQADAFEFLARWGREFHLVHASPPCQAYTRLAAMTKKEYPELIPAARAALMKNGRPWIMENVKGAPLLNPVELCGSQFGLKVYRHRIFESSHLLLGLPHHPHRDKTPRGGTRGNNISPNGFICVAGHFSNVPYARMAMGINWMTRDELAQAIPPAFTQFLGSQIIGGL
jgi:DNA (cytosine-5)-methyltransferase 1